MVDLIEYFLIHNCLLISFFSNKLTSFRLLKSKQTQLSISKTVKVTNNFSIQFTEIGLLSQESRPLIGLKIQRVSRPFIFNLNFER